MRNLFFEELKELIVSNECYTYTVQEEIKLYKEVLREGGYVEAEYLLLQAEELTPEQISELNDCIEFNKMCSQNKSSIEPFKILDKRGKKAFSLYV